MKKITAVFMLFTILLGFAVIPNTFSANFATPEMVVGVNMWPGTPSSQFADYVPLLNDVGIKHIRIGVNVNDNNVNMLLNNGFEPFASFGTTGLPDLDAFGDYIYDRVNKFKGRINAWLVFNEANWFDFNGDPKGYVDALKVAYTRAKQADPTVKIVCTNLLSVEGGLPFLEEMYNYGAKGYFDILGIDPYCDPQPPTYPNENQFGHTFWNISALRDVMLSNGDDKPVWIVEFGYRTPSPLFPLGHIKGVVTEKQQADYIVDALKLASTWSWCERFYIYKWMDSADVNLGWWGLIKESYNVPYVKKPSYYAVKQYLANSPTPTPASPPPTNYYIIPQVAVAGTGWVLPSSPTAVPSGQTFTCTATPKTTENTRYVFSHWELQEIMVSPLPAPSLLYSNPVTVGSLLNVGSEYTLTAFFDLAPQSYALTITKEGQGTTDPVVGVYQYQYDSVVTVEAHEAEWNHFDVWELDGVNIGSQQYQPVTMDSDHHLHAIFTDNPDPTPTPTSTPNFG